MTGGSNWGGRGSIYGGYLSTTEVLLPGSGQQWKRTGDLPRLKSFQLIITHHRLNDQRCCTVATNVNFPRQLTGVRVTHFNQKTILSGGVDNWYKNRVEVLCGKLQSVF